jgi:transcriptional regulator with XRE-family HTH domain
VEKRKAAGLTQAEVGAKLGRHQPFVSEVEAGQRRVSAVELMDIADAIGFDPHEAVERMKDKSER